MKKIITISREFGAGGGEIGTKLAERLHYQYYDKEIILQAAAESNLDVYSLIEWDEKVPIQFGFGQSLFDFYNRPLSEKIFKAQSFVIREIGEKGNCIIVGRNSNTILKEYEHSLHVFIHARFNWRVERMKEKVQEDSEAKVIEKIKRIDKARDAYCSFHTRYKFGEPLNYDLSLNSEKLGIDKCVDLICDALENV